MRPKRAATRTRKKRFSSARTWLSATGFALALVGGLCPGRSARAAGWCCDNCEVKFTETKCHWGTRVEYCGYCLASERGGYINSNQDVKFNGCDENTYEDPPSAPTDCGGGPPPPPPPDPEENRDPCTNGEVAGACGEWCLSYCQEAGYARVEDCNVDKCTAGAAGGWDATCSVRCGS